MRQINKGYSLIEVMIALSLSLVLIAGLTQIFASNSRTFDVTDASARTQETGRLALLLLSREIRNADYWGCLGSEAVLRGNLRSLLNPWDGFSTSMLLRGLDGEDESGPDGSDMLLLGGLAGSSHVPVMSQTTMAAANLKLENTDPFRQNDIVVVANCQRGHLFQITNVNPSNQVVVHHTGNVSEGPGNASQAINPTYNNDPQGAFLYKPRHQRFYLMDNAKTGRRELVVDGVSVAGGSVGTITSPKALFEGIRNFQLQFGRDTTGNHRVDIWTAPGAPAHADQTLAIRLSILVRSPGDGVTDGAQSYCYPGWLNCADDPTLLTTADTDDTFLYRVYTTTSTLRNRI